MRAGAERSGGVPGRATSGRATSGRALLAALRIGALGAVLALTWPATLPTGNASVSAAWAEDGGQVKTKKKEEEPKRTVDADQVYFGQATAKWKTPAELDLSTVYGEIEEFKTIRKDGLKPSDARYAILMTKVSRKFQKALKKAAKAGSYDLVAALGAVKGVENVPDISQSVIDQL